MCYFAPGLAFGRITRGRLAASVAEVHSFVGYGCVLVCVEREGVMGRSNRHSSSSFRRLPPSRTLIEIIIWREEIGNRNRLVNLAGRNRQ